MPLPMRTQQFRMQTVDFSFGSFALTFTDRGHTWYLAIHPEMVPVNKGISPSGNYFIYCTHPTRGSCSFIIEQDEHCNWLSTCHPPYIPSEIIGWLGARIENRNNWG